MSNRGLVHFSFFNSKGEFDISSLVEVQINDLMIENNIVVDEIGVLVFNEAIAIELMDELEIHYGNIRWNDDDSSVPMIGGSTHKVSQLDVPDFMNKVRAIMVEYCGDDMVSEIKYVSRSFVGLDAENIFEFIDGVNA